MIAQSNKRRASEDLEELEDIKLPITKLSKTIVESSSNAKPIEYIKCCSIPVFDGLIFDISMEPHDSQKCDKCIPCEPLINDCISEEHISLLIGALIESSREDVITALIELKNIITKKSINMQNKVCDTHFLIQQIFSLCTTSRDLEIQELNCYLLFELSKNNKYTTEFIFGNISIIKRFKQFIADSNAHLDSNSCNSECMHENNGVSECRIMRIGKNAIWMLSEICKIYPQIKGMICDSKFIELLFKYLNNPDELSRLASMNLINNIINKSEQFNKLFKREILIDYFVNIFNTCKNHEKLIATCICTSLCEDSDTEFKLTLSNKLLDTLVHLLNETYEYPYIQLNIILIINKLCLISEIQNKVSEKGIINIYLAILNSKVLINIKYNIINSLMTICSKNTSNQTLCGELGIIEKLLSFLELLEYTNSQQNIYSIFVAFVFLCAGNNVNIEKFIGVPTSLHMIRIYLNCSSYKLQNITCGLIRVLSTGTESSQFKLVTYGILPELIERIRPTNSLIESISPIIKFTENIPEIRLLINQTSITSIYNLISPPSLIQPSISADDATHVASYVINLRLLNELNCHSIFFDILEDNIKSTNTIYMFAILCLQKLCMYNRQICEEIRARPTTIDALVRFTKSYDLKLRTSATNLLSKILPELPQNSTKSMLSVFKTFVPTCPSEDDCVICSDALSKEVVFLPCIHKFHKECVGKWFNEGRDTCPTCKVSIMDNIHNLIGINPKIMSVVVQVPLKTD